MAIGKITGQMLNYNLDRAGTDLVIDTNLTYFDVTNRRLGINTTSPVYPLDVRGNARLGNLHIRGNTITSDLGKIDLGAVSNVRITGGSTNYVLVTDGNGNLSFGNISLLVASGGASFTGADIILGSNTAGVLVSNAVALTTSSSVTNSIALMNNILGKLVPYGPPNFPGGQSITLASATTTARMANFTQTDNTLTSGKSVIAGTTISAVRSSSYLTSALTAVGPGDSGTVTVYKNGVASGNKAMTTGTDNGTYGDLVIAADQDYHYVQPTVSIGFYQSFNSYATGTVSSGWNEVYLNDTITSGSTNTLSWYYDSSTPGAPTWSLPTITLSSNVVSYSSTVPHLTTSAGFTIVGNVAKLSGDMYYSSDTFVTGAAGGALTSPISVTYAQANIPTPLARNLYVSSGSTKITTTCNVISGFGSSATGPTLTAYNSYSIGSQVFTPAGIVLYKTGTSNQIEETSLTIGSVGVGSGNPQRIVNPGSGDTPTYTGTETIFNSQTSTLQTYDATVVGAVLKNDTTNYSTGYFPVGPNLSTQAAEQYFTFRFIRTGVSKFDVLYTGTLAGLWVALPGSQIDVSSSLNGWLNLSQPYNGSGIPGSNLPGNGSDGASVGGTAILNTPQTSKRVTATFGTVSSSNTANNYIYVRVKLTAGQSLTALQIQAASN